MLAISRTILTSLKYESKGKCLFDDVKSVGYQQAASWMYAISFCAIWHTLGSFELCLSLALAPHSFSLCFSRCILTQG